MPQQAWGDKRERQYEHVKESAKKRGTSTGRAEEVAARTVNKNRARTGSQGRTKDQLYQDAMTKAELARAVGA